MTVQIQNNYTKAAISKSAAFAKYKMTTDIPEEIITPDKVSSRIGELNFFDGFPITQP